MEKKEKPRKKHKKYRDIKCSCCGNKIDIDEMIKNIDNANFKIEPKIKGIDNISCKFCKYQSICFKTEKDNKYIYPDEELKFLRGDENA